MITDSFTINVHARVVVYMYLIFVMTGQNISNDGDKGVQICISPTFIEPRAFIREKVWNGSMLTVALTGAAMFVNWRARHGRKIESIADRHTD